MLQITAERVRNSEISARTRLSTTRDVISKQLYALFGHVARLPAPIPDIQALGLQVDSSLNRFPPCSANWKRRPGRPRGRWVDQLRQDNYSTTDLWHSAIRRVGHSAAMLRSLLTIGLHAFRLDWPGITESAQKCDHIMWEKHPLPVCQQGKLSLPIF